jgi:hypothetical protein
MREAVKVSHDSPVLLDRFLNDAIEVDVDCISDGETTFIGGVMEHIEQAGVHSGDSACSLPPYSLSQDTIDELKRQTSLMAKGLNVVGLMNVQFAIQQQRSRRQGPGHRVCAGSEPARLAHRAFVSKATGLQLAKIAARCMVGQTLAQQGITKESRAAVLQRQGSRVPVREIPGRRHHPRPGNEVDRRSDGRRHDLRRSLREVAAGRRRQPADLGPRVPVGEGLGQAAHRAGGARPGRWASRWWRPRAPRR